MNRLDISDWKEFKIAELFDINPTRYHKLINKDLFVAVLNFTSREFRSQQAHVFDLADQGEKIVIRRSKKQAYTLVPVEDEDITFTKSLEERIGMALQEVKQMREGKIKELSMNDLLDEL